MRVVAAPDSFKGSASATAAAAAIARGVLAAAPDASVVEVPLADGGEGTVEALVAARGGAYAEAAVADPLGRKITARYGFLSDGKTAVIEMAAASGLPLLSREERNPMVTTTFGTGQLILDAISRGASEIVIGIGGSATVDGGTGMARALGVRFLDAQGKELTGGGEILQRIRRIDVSGRDKCVNGVRITAASDVTNALTGPEGAAAVYGPQKGATRETVAALDAGLANLAARTKADLGVDIADVPGGGAAGGLGAGLRAFLGAKIRSGIEIVLEAVDLAWKVRDADLVFTGEGRVDGQSAYGKAVSGAAQTAQKAGVPCILLAGAIGEGAGVMLERGVSAMFSIAQGPAGEGEMMAQAEALIEAAAQQATRAFLAGFLREAHS